MQIRLTSPELVALLTRIFLRNGVSARNALVLAENCAACERDGNISHGIFRIPGYIASLRSGWVDGKAVPHVQSIGPSYVRVDGRNGFAQPAWQCALPVISEMAERSGVAVLAIRNSHHFSALWPDLEPLANSGLVGITMVTGMCCVAPTQGHSAALGTNPIAFATPVAGRPPLIFDFATSAQSNGDLRLAALAGHQVPPDSGIDAMGNETTNPNEILNGGALRPFGGHKGAAISLMVEILASALTGGEFSSEVDLSAYPGAETQRTGQLAIVLNPVVGGNMFFAERVRQLLQVVRAAGQERLPSDRRYQVRTASEADGIPITEQQYESLLQYA
jgi:delta1-piperideine-2-carboxylate reductase